MIQILNMDLIIKVKDDTELNTEDDLLKHELLKDIIVHQYSQAKKKKSFARCPIVYNTKDRPENTSKRIIY